MNGTTYHCGPVRVHVSGSAETPSDPLSSALGLYTAPWEQADSALEVGLEPAPCSPGGVSDSYLHTARMRVETTTEGLRARCESGAVAEFNRALARWTIGVPPGSLDVWAVTDLENLASLVVTTAWRDLGWTPLHAGLVFREDGPAVLVCAESGGGKTTMTLGFLRRGWKTLGDDKLLLRSTGRNSYEARALVHSFNLAPEAARFFPEIGDISARPKYSVWTEKRRVPIAHLRPDATRTSAQPTHVIQVVRTRQKGGLTVRRLDSPQILNAVLRQTVIPTHRPTAQQIMTTVAGLARQLIGFRVELGEDAYRDPECLAALEHVLRSG